MRWVDQAAVRPHRCAVLPYVGNGRGNAFLDTGQELDLEHVYVSDVAIDEMARLRGWVHPGALTQAQAKIAELEAQARELGEKLTELEEFRQSVDFLAPYGFIAKKLPGRPKQKTEV